MTDTGYSGPAEYWEEFERENVAREVVPATPARAVEVRSTHRRDAILKTAMNIVAVVLLAAFLGAALWYGK